MKGAICILAKGPMLMNFDTSQMLMAHSSSLDGPCPKPHMQLELFPFAGCLSSQHILPYMFCLVRKIHADHFLLTRHSPFEPLLVSLGSNDTGKGFQAKAKKTFWRYCHSGWTSRPDLLAPLAFIRLICL